MLKKRVSVAALKEDHTNFLEQFVSSQEFLNGPGRNRRRLGWRISKHAG